MMRWMAGFFLVASLVLGGVAWSKYHRLTSHQQWLLQDMTRLANAQTESLPQESLLQKEQQLTRNVAAHDATAGATLAAATAQETRRISADVQTSAGRWLADQQEFAAIADQRIHDSYILGGLAGALLLGALIAPRLRRHPQPGLLQS